MFTESIVLIETFILSGVAGASFLLVRELRVARSYYEPRSRAQS